MSRTLSRTLTMAGLTLGLAVPVLGSSTANADPQNGFGFPVTCGNTTYQVVTNGNGEWTPVHDTDSNVVLIPHAFGGEHGEILDTDGNVVDTFDNPPDTKGSGKQKGDVECSYEIRAVSDGSDPEGPPAGYTFHVVGTATVKIAGHS